MKEERTYSGSTVGLQWVYSGSTVALQWLYSGSTVALQWLYSIRKVNTRTNLLITKSANKPY